MALLYLSSLDPDVGFWDTGEMNAVPYFLGLAHPTGFPTEILLGWLCSHAIPLGDVSYRLTLLNAFEIACAAAAAGLHSLQRMGSQRGLAAYNAIAVLVIGVLVVFGVYVGRS